MSLRVLSSLLALLFVFCGIPAMAAENLPAPQASVQNGPEFDFSSTDDINRYDTYSKKVTADGLEYVDAPLYNEINNVRPTSIDRARYGAFLRSQDEVQTYSFLNLPVLSTYPIGKNILTIYADPEVQFTVTNSDKKEIATEDGTYDSTGVKYYKKSLDGDKVVYFIELISSGTGKSTTFVQFSTSSSTAQPHYSFWFGNPLTKEGTATGGLFTVSITSPNRASAKTTVRAPYVSQKRAWVKTITIEPDSEFGATNVSSASLTMSINTKASILPERIYSSSDLVFDASLWYDNAAPVSGTYTANLSSVSWRTGVKSGSRYSYTGTMKVDYLYAFGA